MTTFRILGPIEAAVDDRPVAIGGPRQVMLFAFLLLRANRAVSSDVVGDAVWGPARSDSDNRLHMGIARLRKALEPISRGGRAPLRTVSGGYVLSVARGELDAEVFELGIRDGRYALDAGEAERASELFSRALGLWRGPALAEVAFEDFAQPEIRRLEELRLAAVEARADAELALGHHASLIAELEGLAVAQPARERLAGLLMLALYRSGRQADALEVYQHSRVHLVQQLGLEPGPALTALQVEILQHAPSLELTRLSPYNAGETSGLWAPVPMRVGGGLPVRSEALFGRERELDELSLLLLDPAAPLMTLTGTGGAGKTTLALAAARRTGSRFSDGVTVVWLAGISEESQVLPELARVLEIEVAAQEPALQILTRALRSQQRLLVLDNFEHVIRAAPALGRLVASCPQLKVLVTSRAPLHLSLERVHRVGGLAVPELAGTWSMEALRRCPASAMFLDRARAADASFELTPGDVSAVAELCRHLGGLPLALELAAARMIVLSATEILERLRTSSEPLGPGRRDAPERHRTLQATIDWSFKLLTMPQQRLFAVLGLFVGGFDVEAAEVVCVDSEQNVVDGLATLVDHGLIHRASARDRARLSMLEPIREFAIRRLRDDDRYDEIVLRQAVYYARVAESAEEELKGAGALDCVAHLDDELSNFRAVLSGAVSQPRLDIALRIACALTDYWYLRDLVSETRAWMASALSQPTRDRAIRTRSLYALGVAACLDGELEQATAALEECLRLSCELPDASLIASCEAQLALTERNQGDDKRADARAERARSLAAETRDPWTEATVLMVTGAATRGYDDARAQLQQARTVLDSLQNKIWPAHINSNLGYAAIVAGDYGYARLTVERALIDARPILALGWKAKSKVVSVCLICSRGARQKRAGISAEPSQSCAASGSVGVCARHSLPSPHWRRRMSGTSKPPLLSLPRGPPTMARRQKQKQSS